ncbi:hypothetical protein C8R43DRAFT_1044539 [Mycena crocata]|nr:hypothetical protein C8R43DRAFT_1044539 [Mycena crocata]
MPEETHLPPFLVPFGEPTKTYPRQGVFNHPNLGTAHSLWWDTESTHPPEALLLFIPGNPGLLNFYTEFLSSIHRRHPRLAIFAHAHLAHTPGITSLAGEHGLRAQVQSAIEALDAVLTAFGQVKVILSGHSVGAWIVLQILKARRSDVFRMFLLCPTLTHIADTPNGRRLHWLFRSPFPWVISRLSYLTRPLPVSLLFPHWSFPQIAVLRSLLNSPASILACLNMAHEEMVNIRELDTLLLEENRSLVYILFAEQDEWVSTHKATIMLSFAEDPARVVDANVPHAFCITHSVQVTSQCSIWLSTLGL